MAESLPKKTSASSWNKRFFSRLFMKVRKTETINNNLNPDWGFLYMSLQELCDADADMKLQVQYNTRHLFSKGTLGR